MKCLFQKWNNSIHYHVHSKCLNLLKRVCLVRKTHKKWNYQVLSIFCNVSCVFWRHRENCLSLGFLMRSLIALLWDFDWISHNKTSQFKGLEVIKKQTVWTANDFPSIIAPCQNTPPLFQNSTLTLRIHSISFESPYIRAMDLA